jgi:hypothetical protein
VLATAAALATAGACWTAYLRVHDTLVSEFEHRIVQIATTAAAQVAPETVAEARTGGDETGGYLAIQVQLLTLRNAAGLDNVSLVDGSRATLVDVRAPDVTERLPSALDSLARPALARALAGAAAVSAEYLAGGHRLRAAIAPVRDGNAVTAAVAVEAEPAYAPTLDSLARRLTLIALLSVAAIVCSPRSSCAQRSRRRGSSSGCRAPRTWQRWAASRRRSRTRSRIRSRSSAARPNGYAAVTPRRNAWRSS